jgi:hypothetical protein
VLSVNSWAAGHDVAHAPSECADLMFFGSENENEDEDLTIIACGPMVPEAMRAALPLRSARRT